MEISESVKSDVKNTIGYDEAKNKESFMVGCSVAFKKSEDFYTEYIKQLKGELVFYSDAYENANAELKTVAAIINKYSDHD